MFAIQQAALSNLKDLRLSDADDSKAQNVLAWPVRLPYPCSIVRVFRVDFEALTARQKSYPLKTPTYSVISS
jgi:hypothetical protein